MQKYNRARVHDAGGDAMMENGSDETPRCGGFQAPVSFFICELQLMVTAALARDENIKSTVLCGVFYWVERFY